MAIIKCKMCGGDIEISADKTFGTCEYCGSTMTLPKTDDDQRLSLFNRGTHLRRNGEFDKAAAIYERLIGVILPPPALSKRASPCPRSCASRKCS